MTLTVTPEPANLPPRVRIDLELDPGESIIDVVLTRNGTQVRQQPYPGGPATTTFDYEAPFGQPVLYEVSGTYLPTSSPDWTEAWASLAAWTGSDFTVSAGKARSTVFDAEIVRAASGTIQRLSVTDPSYVRIELLDDADEVVASVQVGANVIVTGTTAIAVTGGGSFVATLVAGDLSVQAADASWSVTRTYEGIPTKVRVVSLGMAYPQTLAFNAGSFPGTPAVDSAGNIYVPMAASTVKKFSPAGALLGSFSTTAPPRCIGVDSSDNVYVVTTDNVLRKFNTAGVAGGTVSTVGAVFDLDFDAAGNIYVADVTSSLVRKFNPALAQTLSFSIAGFICAGLAINAANHIVLADATNNWIRSFNAGGFPDLAVFPIGGTPEGIAIDGTNLFVADRSNLIRKFESGVQTAIIPTGVILGVNTDAAGNVYVGDVTSDLVRKFTPTTPSVGAIAPRLLGSPQPLGASATVTLDVDEAWLIHPTLSTLSCSIDPGQHKWRDDGINVDAATKSTVTRSAKATRHDPSGRSRAVIFTSGTRGAGEWDLKLMTRRLQDRNVVDAICDDQTPLLLRTPPTWPWDIPDGWYSVGDYSEERPRPRLDQPDRLITLPLTPVSEPAVRLAAVWTYATDLLIHATYKDSRDAFPTYLDRLVGS